MEIFSDPQHVLYIDDSYLVDVYTQSLFHKFHLITSYAAELYMILRHDVLNPCLIQEYSIQQACK